MNMTARDEVPMETQWNPMEPNLMTSNGTKQNLMLVNLWGAYGAYGT